jgi:hypothetical protein
VNKQSEQALFLANSVESSEDAIISKDLKAVGAQRIFGFTEAEAVGQPIACHRCQLS